MNFRSASSVIGIALVLVYVVGSGLWVNTGDGWYRSLNKPTLQPPDFIFGLLWPYNFIVLGIAAVVVSQRASSASLRDRLIINERDWGFGDLL
jgi:translocator protein